MFETYHGSAKRELDYLDKIKYKKVGEEEKKNIMELKFTPLQAASLCNFNPHNVESAKTYVLSLQDKDADDIEKAIGYLKNTTVKEQNDDFTDSEF